MSNIEPESYEEQIKFLEERIAQIPEDLRWRFYIQQGEDYCATGISTRSPPCIVDITAPKVTNINRHSSGGYRSSDSGFGSLAAGAVGFMLGSALDD